MYIPSIFNMTNIQLKKINHVLFTIHDNRPFESPQIKHEMKTTIILHKLD